MNNNFLKTISLAFLLFGLFSLQACEDDVPEVDETEQDVPPSTVEFIDGKVVPPTETACGVSDTLDLLSDAIIAGEVILANDIDSFYVTIEAREDWYLSDFNLFIGDKRNVPVTDELIPNLAEFPFKTNFDPLVQSYQYSMSLNDFRACEDILVNVTANRLNSDGEILETDSFWIDGEPLEGIASEGESVQYCLEECIVKYPVENVATMAFEDLYPEPGDSDYNDFVTGMNANVYYVGPNVSRVNMTFTALARGSGFDHNFRLGFPIDGTANITIKRFASPESDEPYEVEELINVGGVDFNFSIFPNTKTILPPQDARNHTNTNPGTTYIAPPRAEVEITINEGEVLLPVPFDPYLIITNNQGVVSELHIAELTQEIDADGDGNKDYWDEDGSIYPFGIVMFKEWLWPLEFENILSIYPNFEYVLIDGIFRPRDPQWYWEPVEGTNYFQRDLFE